MLDFHFLSGFMSCMNFVALLFCGYKVVIYSWMADSPICDHQDGGFSNLCKVTGDPKLWGITFDMFKALKEYLMNRCLFLLWAYNISFLFQWQCHYVVCSKLLWNLFIPRSVKRVRPETFYQKYHPPEHPRFSHGSPSPAFPSKAQTIHFPKITKLHLSKAGKKGPCKHGWWWWWKLQLARLSFPDLNYIYTTVLDPCLGAGNPVPLRTMNFSHRLEARYKNRNLDLIHVYHQRWPVLRRKKKTNKPDRGLRS